LCLFVADKAEYGSARRDLLSQFRNATARVVAERVGRACLLLPAADDELQQAVALTERAVVGGPRGHEFAFPYYVFAQGLARYRQGRFDEAVKLMTGDAASVLGPSPRLVLAMAQYQKGQKDQARTTLAAAVACYDWNPAKANNHDAWIAHVLRLEAESLLKADLPNETKKP
jgi:serine/threonine-protein kinase